MLFITPTSHWLPSLLLHELSLAQLLFCQLQLRWNLKQPIRRLFDHSRRKSWRSFYNPISLKHLRKISNKFLFIVWLILFCVLSFVRIFHWFKFIKILPFCIALWMNRQSIYIWIKFNEIWFWLFDNRL
jgi:hypothetical protein